MKKKKQSEKEMTEENSENKQSETEKQQEKIKNLETEIADIEEKMIRMQAETANYRKRKDEEHERMIQMASAEVIKAILPYLDDFERAIAMDNENPDDELTKFLSGFKMIYQNLMNTLYQFNLKEINGINKPFDPVYHEAVLTEEREDKEPDMVIEILQKGYLLNGRVLRPAKVKVSKKKGMMENE